MKRWHKQAEITKARPADDPDIVLRGIEGPLVGPLPGLRGRDQVNQVIDKLLGVDDADS